jgi:hypothetical protein
MEWRSTCGIMLCQIRQEKKSKDTNAQNLMTTLLVFNDTSDGCTPPLDTMRREVFQLHLRCEFAVKARCLCGSKAPARHLSLGLLDLRELGAFWNSEITGLQF